MTDTWLHNFEAALQRLETAAMADAALSELHRLTEACVGPLADRSRVCVWLRRQNSAERLTSATVDEDKQAVEDDAGLAEKLHGLAESGHAIFDSTSTDHGTTAGMAEKSLLVASPLAVSVACVLQVRFNGLNVPESSFIEACRVVVDVLARYVGRHELSGAEDRLQRQAALTGLATRLQRATSLAEAASLVAQDGVAVFGDCRISVLTNQSGRWKMRAATGVRDVNRYSETVRQIESLAASDEFASWTSPPTVSADAETAAINPTSMMRILKLHRSDAANQPSPFAAISVELFEEQSQPDEGLVEQFREIASNGLLRWCRTSSRIFGSTILNSRAARWATMVAVLMLALAFIPARFEVEVPGQITSPDRQRIFAPENGTIAVVLFENEASVLSGDILLRMTNADLELELQRIQGEYDSAAAELTAVRAQRITDSQPELSGTEQRLEQRMKHLRELLRLLQNQIDSLNVVAPFSGTVFRKDPLRELMSRPVQRGQLLLEIVPADTQWQLELTIPDHLAAYVRERVSSVEDAPAVRFMLKAAPDQTLTATLGSIDDAFQVIDGRIVCRATAELDSLSNVDLRSGESASAFIDCGKRSLGFVWFREVIEFWHQLQFAWF
ncbi:efflux RND transporter periplasmic adaptor subunit [Fuerstiella marisgermanici]|uniref:Efflux transporter, RND family, MFP subunit n=1 Tax=Fuerstiella marisgermanici TaxID=1891926 RepID=A0A1P8WG67_9PLAN|nr:HlyD family secretion protein [Fuerstiella marisgermanici]APZ93066.1 efflux transporter, RND family, MFP subunit [Fuerstiella marisgermanici]